MPLAFELRLNERLVCNDRFGEYSGLEVGGRWKGWYAGEGERVIVLSGYMFLVRLVILPIFVGMGETKITIDLTKWQTITSKANEMIGKQSGKPVSVEYVCKLIRLGKLKGWKIEELGLHLVER